jgi:osmotically inducible protein OsmC
MSPNTAERRAEVVGTGTLATGGGSLALRSSGVAGALPVHWASRTGRSDGKTSPEELLAAAHASCLSMGLSHGLTEAGTPPDELCVSATVTFAQTEAGFTVSASAPEVTGVVPGIDAAGFAAAAEAAKDGCPISQALMGNVELSVTARLA